MLNKIFKLEIFSFEQFEKKNPRAEKISLNLVLKLSLNPDFITRTDKANFKKHNDTLNNHRVKNGFSNKF